MFSHDLIFRTNKESSIWRQNDHHLRRASDQNRACPISILFFKITDPCVGRSFSMCSHDLIFGNNINRILKNGSCERAFRSFRFLCATTPTYPPPCFVSDGLSTLCFVSNGKILAINKNNLLTEMCLNFAVCHCVKLKFTAYIPLAINNCCM